MEALSRRVAKPSRLLYTELARYSKNPGAVQYSNEHIDRVLRGRERPLGNVSDAELSMLQSRLKAKAWFNRLKAEQARKKGSKRKGKRKVTSKRKSKRKSKSKRKGKRKVTSKSKGKSKGTSKTT